MVRRMITLYSGVIGRRRHEWSVTPGEVFHAIKRKASGNTAPGLDGLIIAAWKKIPEEMFDMVVKCFEICFRKGTFPVE